MALSVSPSRRPCASPTGSIRQCRRRGPEFSNILRDYSHPVRRVAELVGCVDGRPNCALARSDLIGMKVRGVDGKEFRDDQNVADQIIGAFNREGAAGDESRDFELNLFDRQKIRDEILPALRASEPRRSRFLRPIVARN